MILLLLVTLIAAVGLIGTVRAVATDGYRATPTDPARHP